MPDYGQASRFTLLAYVSKHISLRLEWVQADPPESHMSLCVSSPVLFRTIKADQQLQHP
jgi:ribosome maturation factor RimP